MVEEKKRKSNPPEKKALNVLGLVGILSKKSLTIERMVELFTITKETAYRYIRTIVRFGLHVYKFPLEPGGTEVINFSLRPDKRKVVKVIEEYEDGSRREFVPDDLAIMPVPKYPEQG